MRPIHTNSCLPSIGSRVDDDNYLSLSSDDSDQLTMVNHSYKANVCRVAADAGIDLTTIDGVDYE